MNPSSLFVGDMGPPGPPGIVDYRSGNEDDEDLASGKFSLAYKKAKLAKRSL